MTQEPTLSELAKTAFSREELNRETYFLMMTEDLPPRRALVQAVWNTAMWFAMILRCRIIGHKMADVGHANAECGCIHVVCDRCGWDTGTHWLY